MPRTGIEPARIAPYAPQAYASTNFATPASGQDSVIVMKKAFKYNIIVFWSVSSTVEHFVYIEGVRGSNPLPTTKHCDTISKKDTILNVYRDGRVVRQRLRLSSAECPHHIGNEIYMLFDHFACPEQTECVEGPRWPSQSRRVSEKHVI